MARSPRPGPSALLVAVAARELKTADPDLLPSPSTFKWSLSQAV